MVNTKNMLNHTLNKIKILKYEQLINWEKENLVVKFISVTLVLGGQKLRQCQFSVHVHRPRLVHDNQCW